MATNTIKKDLVQTGTITRDFIYYVPIPTCHDRTVTFCRKSTTGGFSCRPVSVQVCGTTLESRTYTATIPLFSSDTGWNAAARSVKAISGDGIAEFRVKQDSSGVMIGLNEIDDSLGHGYVQINCGLFATQGQFQPVKSGIAQSGLQSFVESDVFKIIRIGNDGVLLRNDAHVFTFDNVFTPNTDVLLDISLYTSGDAVFDADITPTVKSASGAATATATMGANALGFGTATATASMTQNGIIQTGVNVNVQKALMSAAATAKAIAPIHDAPMSAAATMTGLAVTGESVVTSFSPMVESIADIAHAEVVTSFSSMTEESYTDNIVVDISGVISTFTPMYEFGYMLTGGNSLPGSGGAFQSSMVELSAEADYGEIKSSFSSMSEEIITQDISYVEGGIWETTLLAQGHEIVKNAVTGTGWKTGIEAYGGGQVNGSIWKTTPTITGTNDAYGVVNGGIWKTTVSIAGLNGAGGVLNVTSRPKTTAQIFGGATVSGSAWSSALSSSGFNGGAATVNGSIWKTTLTTSVTQPAFGIVTGKAWKTLTLYGITTGTIWKTTLLSNDVPVAPRSIAYSMNIRTAETSQYTNYDFDYIVRFNRDYYGVKPDGLYLLKGADDNGAAINAKAITSMMDFGTERHKRVPFAYLDSDTATNIRPIVDGVAKSLHLSGFGGRKTSLARGNKGRFWEFELTNTSGGGFKVGGVELLEDVLSRRV